MIRELSKTQTTDQTRGLVRVYLIALSGALDQVSEQRELVKLGTKLERMLAKILDEPLVLPLDQE